MIDEIKKEIEQRLENVDTLPKTTKAEITKVEDYIDDGLKNYKELFEQTELEIKRRYEELLQKDTQTNETNFKIDNIDFSLAKIIDPSINCFYKMDLDYLIFKLNHFYKDDLNTTNIVIRQILDKFNEIGIKLTSKDFRITNYVHIYMDSILDNNININQVFNSIYWECPNFLIQIVINFYQIYFKNLKKIKKYYKKYAKKAIALDKYIMDRNADYCSQRDKEHQDRIGIINKFINKEVSIADFTQVSLDKTKSTLLTSNPNYVDLLMFEETLSDYTIYLKYQFIIDDVKKLYQEKKSYKGLFNQKLKEISKLERQLTKLSRKTLYVNNDEKVSEAKLKIDNMVSEIDNKYHELTELFVKDDLFNYVNDQDSWAKILRIVINNFNYIEKIISQNNELLTLPEIEEQIMEIKRTLYSKYSSILDNISIGGNVNTPRIIADKYRLLNFIISEQNLNAEEIETFIRNAKILILNFDMKNVGLKYDDIQFILNVNKILNKK